MHFRMSPTNGHAQAYGELGLRADLLCCGCRFDGELFAMR
jgi:hypothetical protein